MSRSSDDKDMVYGFAAKIHPLAMAKIVHRQFCGGRSNVMIRRYCVQYLLICCISSVLLLQVIRMLLPPNLTRGSDCLERRYYRQPALSTRSQSGDSGYQGDAATPAPGRGDEIYVPRCDVVHIASRCYGEEELYNLTLLVKSVLYFSRSAVKWHVVTDEAGRHVLQTLLNSWELQHVAMQYYVSPKTRVIEYFVKNPPTDTNHLLVVKPYVVFLSDVTHFWQLAKQNSSDRYVIRGIDSHHTTVQESVELPRSEKPNYHSIEGVILRLSELRHRSLCPTLGSSSLEEVRPDYAFIFLVACKSQHHAMRKESDLSHIPRIVQTGILDPTQVSERFLPEMYKHIVGLQGDTLRNRIVEESCSWIYTRPVVQFDQTQLLDDYCYDYRFQACISRRTHLYFNVLDPAAIFKPLDNSTHDVTMVTQLQYNRLPGLLTLINSWNGPLQVTMYLTDEEVQMFRDDIYRYSGLRRKGVHIHVVYKRQLYYPINMLRNIGLREVKTEYVFVVDVDFVPMPGLHTRLVSVIDYLHDQQRTQRAVIVPTFETFDAEYEVPASKRDFIRDIHLGRVEPYHQGTFWSFKDGHKPHNYPKWFDASSPYKVKWVPKFEPYIMLPTRDSPLYEEILVERMQDKMPYTLEIVLKGYTFFVLHDAYIVHFPHPKSMSHSWTRDPKFYRCGSYFYDSIANQLEEKYIESRRKLKQHKTSPAVPS